MKNRLFSQAVREIIAQVEAELAAQTGTPFRFREPPDDGYGWPGEWEE